MALTQLKTAAIADDAVTEDKLANAINTARAANTAKDLTALSASNLTSGTVPDARFPATLPAASGANLTSLTATNLTGTIADARFPATLPAASAANLTSIPAANITGTLPAISGANLTNLPGGGKILQVVESTSDTMVTTTSGSNAESDLITISITPASASNKVLLFVTFVGQANPSTNSKGHVRLYRGTSSGTLILELKQGSGDAEYRTLNMTGSKLDSPNTTSAQTYTVTIARLSGGTNTVSSDGNYYHIQAMEVGA